MKVVFECEECSKCFKCPDVQVERDLVECPKCGSSNVYILEVDDSKED